MVGQIANAHDRHDAGCDVGQGQARIGAEPVFPAEEVPAAVLMEHADELLFIDDDDRQDSAELDEDFKDAGPGTGKAEHIADENHMACR